MQEMHNIIQVLSITRLLFNFNHKNVIIFLQIYMFCVIMTSVIRSLFPQGGASRYCLPQGASYVVTPLFFLRCILFLKSTSSTGTVGWYDECEWVRNTCDLIGNSAPCLFCCWPCVLEWASCNSTHTR